MAFLYAITTSEQTDEDKTGDLIAEDGRWFLTRPVSTNIVAGFLFTNRENAQNVIDGQKKNSVLRIVVIKTKDEAIKLMEKVEADERDMNL